MIVKWEFKISAHYEVRILKWVILHKLLFNKENLYQHEKHIVLFWEGNFFQVCKVFCWTIHLWFSWRTNEIIYHLHPFHCECKIKQYVQHTIKSLSSLSLCLRFVDKGCFNSIIIFLASLLHFLNVLFQNKSVSTSAVCCDAVLAELT